MKVSAESTHGAVEVTAQARTEGNRTVEELFREHAAFVASFVVRLGVQPRDAPDVVQEVFLIAHKKGGYVAGPAHPRTWLAAIAVRRASEYRRSRHRRELITDAPPETADGARDPEGALEVRQALGRVERALESLDVEHRAAFLLFEVEGISCAEIASSLGIPTGTVYSRLHHARERFQRAYDREDREAKGAAR
jgi:RNA polymerase sigma-70 factor (ECF subfamily)